jgi:hypothetical protein
MSEIIKIGNYFYYTISLNKNEIQSLAYIADRYGYAEAIYDSMTLLNEKETGKFLREKSNNKKYIFKIPESAAFYFRQYNYEYQENFSLAGGTLLEKLLALDDIII